LNVRLLFFALSLAVSRSSAQLPASGTFSDTDMPLFRAEVARMEKALAAAADKGTATYEIARTWAAGKQWPETIEWLRKVVALNGGLDPSRDAIFAELRGTREFKDIIDVVRAATPTISHSKEAFKILEGDLVPESVAYDPAHRQFYFGSMKKGKVARCSTAGQCAEFASGLGIVLGLKAQGKELWVLSNSDKESALVRYDIASGAVVRRYAVGGPGHNFNDLVIAPSGDVYLTDTRASAVWRLPKGGADLTRLPGRFEFANGIALSPESSQLYVATYPDGITVLDLKTQAAAPIPRPANLCLATIDGLYFHRGALIAIQNAFMSPRVVRFTLTRDFRAIEQFEVLERRNPLFDGVTTGVLVGGDFFYMANIQDEKTSGFDPITILKLHL
jgi:SMP-30/Gluconolactonase/LRE-like region